jgi:hypothetical protein
VTGSGRDVFRDFIPAFVWRDLGKLYQTSFKIFGLVAEILRNTCTRNYYS